MRNLKRALSLTLASVMLLGMMVIGTSAASYPDVTEEHNVEAIEVLQAVGVMSGSDSGNFNPDSKVSRIEMAVVMSNLLNLKVDYFENQCRFTDVPAWAGKYVAACEASGIVSGIGNNQFGTGNVTATQAALMMLKALGYFQYASDFNGGWEQQTAKLAANLSLFKGMTNVANVTELTRNQVAQLALNTLKTPVVVAEDNTMHITGGSGDTNINITGGSVTYKVTASNDAYARAISSVEGSDQTTVNGIQGYVIELGEKLYDGKLQLKENARDGEVYDDFGRPARRWQYDGKTFGTYTKTEELRQEYTKKVTGKMLYDELGSDIVRSVENNGQWNLNVTIDGETSKTVLDTVKPGTFFSIASIKRTNTDKVGDTGNGVLTQVYVDSVHHEVNIAIINTYLAIADQDYNEKDDDVDLTVYHIGESPDYNDCFVKTGPATTPNVFNGEETIAAKGDKLDIVDVKEDDKYLVTIAQGEIQSMVKPEVVAETTINSFKKTDWVKNDDAQYDYASTAQYDEDVLDEYDAVNMKDVTYNVILDKYGYLVGLELNEGVSQYAFLTGIDLGDSNLSVKNATGNLIFLDGTMKTVTINVEKSQFATAPKGSDGSYKSYTTTGGGADLSGLNEVSGDLYVVQNDHTPTATTRYAQLNTWCTYTEDGNGVYTLKQVGSYSKARDDSNPVKGAKKVAQSYVDMASYTDSKDANELPINNKNTSIPGSKGANASGVLKPKAKQNNSTITPSGDFDYVYGNNDTVYINVKLKAVTPKGAPNDKLSIVDKVDSAVTGIANVDFTVAEIDKTGDLAGSNVPKAEVYTLYNDKGYAIGVITMDATDNGTSSHFAYITKAVNQEDYMGGSTWRWHVDAIVDGQKVQLTEANDSLEYLENMQPGEWYSVTYDKDGNVSGIKNEGTYGAPIKNEELNFGAHADDKFIEEVEDIRAATNGFATSTFTGPNATKSNSTVLLEKNYKGTDNHTGGNLTACNANIGYLKVDGDTVWTKQNQSAGFRISPETKTVLILSKRHAADLYDTVTDGYKGAEGLDKALKTLKTDTVGGYTKFDGILTAVFKDGVATSIILNDMSGNGHNGVQEQGKPMKVTIKLYDADVREVMETYETDVYASGSFTPSAILAGYPDLAAAYQPVDNTAVTYTYVEGGEWNRTFRYTAKTGGGATEEGATVRVEYWLNADNVAGGGTYLGGKTVTTADKADKLGYATLEKTDLTGDNIVTGYTAANAGNLPASVKTGDVIKVVVVVDDVKAIALNADNAKTEIELLYNAAHGKTDLIAALKAASIKFDVTFGTGDAAKTVTVDADSAFITNVAAKGSFDATANGQITVTAVGASAKTVDVDAKVYANMAAAGTSVTLTNDLASGWTAAGTPSKVYIGQTYSFTVTQDTAATLADLTGKTLAVTSTTGTVPPVGATTNGATVVLTTPGVAANGTATPSVAGTPAVITVTFTVTALSATAFTLTVDVQ